MRDTLLAYDGVRKKLEQAYFAGGDGSVMDRLNRVYNASKHEVASGEQTLWITNEGISADAASISFAELEDLLRSNAHTVSEIINQGPNAEPRGD